MKISIIYSSSNEERNHHVKKYHERIVVRCPDCKEDLTKNIIYTQDPLKEIKRKWQTHCKKGERRPLKDFPGEALKSYHEWQIWTCPIIDCKTQYVDVYRITNHTFSVHGFTYDYQNKGFT